ncbi:MAG: hypothetical protein ABJN69_12880 [Hellea sp.]
MKREGPPLEILLRRLAETPPEFMQEPRIGGRAQVVVPALVNDCVAYFGAPARADTLAQFNTDDPRLRPKLQLVMVLVWLLRHPVLKTFDLSSGDVLSVLEGVPAALGASNAAIYIEDPERREELARTVLAQFKLRPEGESEKQAADRLMAISASERKRLLRASRDAERRAREVREALARKAARESADKWTRE